MARSGPPGGVPQPRPYSDVKADYDAALAAAREEGRREVLDVVRNELLDVESDMDSLGLKKGPLIDRLRDEREALRRVLRRCGVSLWLPAEEAQ